MRYHVIYSVIYIIMYLARGQGDLYSFRNSKNQLELESQDFPFLKNSSTMLKKFTKNLEETSSSEYAGRNFEIPYSTRHSSRKNPKNKKGYSKPKKFIKKEEKNVVESDINLERFNQDNFLRPPGCKEVDPNFNLVSSRDIVSNSSVLGGNSPKFYEKYSSLKLDDGNPEVSKLRRRKSNESGNQNFESKRKQQVEDVLIPGLMDQKGLRKKREISYSSKPRSRKRRFTNRLRREARKTPSRVRRHEIIRLARDKQAQKATEKENSNSKNAVDDKKNENSVSKLNNPSQQEKRSKINDKLQSQGQLPAWQVQEPAAPISRNTSVRIQKNPNNQVFENVSKKSDAPLSNSQNLNSRNFSNKNQQEHLQNFNPVVGTDNSGNQIPLMKDIALPFPSQDKISSSSSGQSQGQNASNNLKQNSESSVVDSGRNLIPKAGYNYQYLKNYQNNPAFQGGNYNLDLGSQNLENLASLDKKLLLNSVRGNSFEKLNENVLSLEGNPLLQSSLSVRNNLENVNNLGNLNTAILNSNLRNSNPNLIGEGTLTRINYLNNPISNYKLFPQQVLLQQRDQHAFWPSSNNYFNFGDKTSDLLSFKAHLHHKVRDIGKRFLQDASNNMNPNQLSDQNLNQFNDQSIKLSNNNLDTNNLYDINQPLSGTNINLPDQPNDLSFSNPYSSGLLENSPLLNPLYNIPAQGLLNPYNNFMNPNLENGYLHNGGPIYNPNLLNPSFPLFQGPYLGNTYDNSLQNLNYLSPFSVQNDPNIIRPVYLQREGRNRESPFRLKYLDNYSKAINNLENSESEQVLDNSDQSNFIGSAVQKGNILGTDNFLNQGSSKFVNDNFGNTNQLESSVSDLHDDADGLEEKGSSYQSDLFEYPLPYYIPQKVLRSNNREDVVIPKGVVSSNVVSNGVKRKSFSSVVEPLTDQLQKLLSTLKNVNENLMNGKNKSQKALQETELVDTPRKKRNLARVKRNSMENEHSLDLDKESKPSAKFKPSLLVDGKTLEEDRKLEEYLISEPNYNKIDDIFAVEKSTGNKSVNGPSTDASNQFKGGKTDLKILTKNDVPKITSIEAKVLDIISDKQKPVVTIHSFTTVNSIKNIFIKETTTMKPEIEEILWSTSSDIRFNPPTTVNRTESKECSFKLKLSSSNRSDYLEPDYQKKDYQEPSGIVGKINLSESTFDVTNNLENKSSSPRSTNSSSLKLDIFQDESQKTNASILNFHGFPNYNQDLRIGSSFQTKNISSGKEMKILEPVMDINVSKFFSELENLAHDTNPSSNDQFSNYSRISESQLSKDLVTKVIRKRSSPEYEPDTENDDDNDNDDNNHENFENQNTYREEKHFDSSSQNLDKSSKFDEDKLDNNCDVNKVIGNGIAGPGQVENHQRRMDRKDIQLGDKKGLFSIFGPRNLVGKDNQRSKLISNIKGRKLNDKGSATAKNVKEIKLIVNKKTWNQVSEPIKDVNLKHNEGRKHLFPESISKRGINKLIKKSDLGSTHSKKHKEDKHIKMIKSKPKLSTWDLKTKSSNKGKKHSKEGQNSRKGRKRKNKNRRNLRRIKSTFSDPEAHIYGRNKIKRRNKEGKEKILKSTNRKLNNTIQRVKEHFPMKKQEYSEENNYSEDKKDFSSKAKISRLEESLAKEDNDQSDEGKYHKSGYARLGRRLQSSTTDDPSTEEYDYKDVEYYTDKGMLATETHSEEEEEYEDVLDEEEGFSDAWTYISEYEDTTQEMTSSTNKQIEETLKVTKTSKEVSSETKLDTTTKVNPERTSKVETGVTTEAVTSETVKSVTVPETTTVQPVTSTTKAITELTTKAVIEATTEPKIETRTQVKPETIIKVETAATTEAIKSVTVPQTTTVQPVIPTTKAITEITTTAEIKATIEPKIETMTQVKPETTIKVETELTEAMTSEVVKTATVSETTAVQQEQSSLKVIEEATTIGFTLPVASTTEEVTRITEELPTESSLTSEIKEIIESSEGSSIVMEESTPSFEISTREEISLAAPATKSLEETTKATKETSSSEEETSKTLEETTEAVEETSEVAKETSETVEEITEVSEITSISEEETSEAIEETTKAEQGISSSTEETSEAVEETTESSKVTSSSVEEISETSGASEETNLSEEEKSETISEEETSGTTEEITDAVQMTSSAEGETSVTDEKTTEAETRIPNNAEATSEIVEETSEAAEVTTVAEEKTSRAGEEISETVEETSEVVATIEAEQITSSSIEETTQESYFEATSEFLTGTASIASEYLTTVQEGEPEEFSSSPVEATSSFEATSQLLSATVIEKTESNEAFKTTESLQITRTTEESIPTSEESASEITKEGQILAESEATETLVTGSTISMQSTEFEQKTFTASPETTSKLEISAATENEATERTEATPEGTIVVEITKETIEQQETITSEGLLTSFDTGPTTEKESQVSKTESSLSVSETSNAEEITTLSLESGTNEEGSSLSATGSTVQIEESSTTHAEETEKPKVESSTESREEGEFEVVYDEELRNKTKNYDEEYDYEDEDVDKAAHEINDTVIWYDYKEDQFSTSEGQSEVEITTKETTEFEISLETGQKEELSSINAEETTATPGLMVELSSLEELPSESISGFTLGTTSKSGLTLETLPDTGLETSSSKHETSILTEITSGFSYGSTTVKEEYKTESKGEMKTSLEAGVTSFESSTLSWKEKEEEERKKKIEEDLKKFEEKEKKILVKGEKKEKTTIIGCEAATETSMSFTDTEEIETSLESEVTTAESSTYCEKEKEEEKKILGKEKEEGATKISSEATTETSKSFTDTEEMETSLESEVTTAESSTHCEKEKEEEKKILGKEKEEEEEATKISSEETTVTSKSFTDTEEMETSLESEVTTAESSTYCGKEKEEEKKILEKEEKAEKMTKISCEAITESSISFTDTGEIETSLESEVSSTESLILCGKEKEKGERKKKIEVDLNKVNEKEKKILEKEEKEEKTNKCNCEATTEISMSLTVTSKTSTIVSKQTTTSAIPTTQIGIPTPNYTKTSSITTTSYIPSTSAFDLKEQKKQKENEEELKKTEKDLDTMEKELTEIREKIKEEVERRKLEEVEQKQREFEEKQTQLEERQNEMEEETEELEGRTACDTLSEEKKEADNDEEEEKDEDNNGKYVFDEDEEVWKNVRPDGFDQEIDRNKIDYKECLRSNRIFSSEKNQSPVTERVCLNVLKDLKSKEVLTNRGKDIVTKFVNMPLVPKDLSDRQNAKRLARKLMTLNDKSSKEVKNSQILKKHLNSNLKRSEVEDTTLKMRQWVVDENGYRIETTNVDRLEDHEWTEEPPQKSKFFDHVDKKCLLQRKKRDFSWKKFWNCLKKSSETTTTKRILVIEQRGSNLWPPQNEQNCEVETSLEQKLDTTEGYSSECSTIPPPTEDNPEKEYPVEDEVEDLEPLDIEDNDEEEEKEEEDEKPGDENLELNDCKEKGVESATLESSEPKKEEKTTSGLLNNDEKETEEEDEGFDEEYEEDGEESEGRWSDYEANKEGTKEKTEKTVKEEESLKESKEEHLRDKEIELISSIENLKRKQDTLKEDILRGRQHLTRILKAAPKTSSITKDSNFFNESKRMKKNRGNGYKNKNYERFKSGMEEESQIEESRISNSELLNEKKIVKRESIQKVEQTGEDHFNDASSNEEYNNFESRIGFKHRKPPGSKWPTERTEKYHVDGSQIWDKEYPCNPILNYSLVHKTVGKGKLKRIERSLSKSSDINSISLINLKSPIQAFYKPGSDKFSGSKIRDGPFYEFLGDDENFAPDETKNTKFDPNIDNDFQKLSKNDLPSGNKKAELEFSKKKAPVLDFSEKLSADSNLNKAIKLAVDIVIAEATKILNDESRIIRTDDVENKFLRKLNFPGEETIDSLLSPESNLEKKKEENIMKTKLLKKRSTEIQDLKKTEINETSTTLKIDIFQNNSSNELKSTSDDSNLSLNPNCSSIESTSISSTSEISSSDISSISENNVIISSAISPIASSSSDNSTNFPGPYFICVPVINSKQNQSNILPPDLGTPNKNYLQGNNQVNFPIRELMVENNIDYNLVNPTGELNENKKREILRLKDEEAEEIRNQLEEPKINHDIDYDEKNNDDYENDYEDILDDEGFGRSLLGFKKNTNSKAHGNKKGLKGKKPQKKIKSHKKNKDRKNHKNQNNGKNLKGKSDQKKSRHDKNEKFLHHSKTPKNKKSQETIKVHEIPKPKSSQMSTIIETDVSVKKEKNYNMKKMDNEKGKNDHTQEKKLSIIEKAELVGPASISPLKNPKSGTNTNDIGKTSSEQIRKEEIDHLLVKVLEMINNQNAADFKGRKNCKVSEKNRKQNAIKQKRRLTRSIIDKVKEMIGHAIGYSKNPENIQEKKIPIEEKDLTRIRSRTRKPKLKSEKRRKKLKHKRHRKAKISEHEKITSLNSNAVSSENNFNSINIEKNHDNKVSFQGSTNGELNVELSNQDNDQQKTMVFKNKSQFSNVKNIIPKVKELVEKQNLGNVDKIIFYVDKDEMKKGSKLELNRVKNLDSSFDSGGQVIKSENLSGKKILPNRKHLENSQASINGVSLDEIVSLAANKVLKSINLLNSPGTSGSSGLPSSDSKLFIRVIQPVAYGTEIPHDEMKTEFTIDLSKFGKIYKPDYPGEDKLFGNRFLVENHETQIKEPFHEKSKNLKLEKNYLSKMKKNLNSDEQVGVKIKEDSKNKSKRLIQHKNHRKMNLPVTPFKRRRFWYEKMKKDEKLDKEDFAQIRTDIIKELNKKFKEAEALRYSQNREEIIRDKRKILNKKLKKVKKVKNHAQSSTKSNINEKIKILYALHHNKNLHKKLREAKVHSSLRRNFFNRNGISKKLGMGAKMKGSSSKESISNLGEEAQEKMLKKKRMVQEFSENSSEEQDSGIEENFSYNREFQRPLLKISTLHHKNQMNDNLMENNDQNDMFGVEDYDEEAKDFCFHQSNGTDVKNISNINVSCTKKLDDKTILTENSRSKSEKIGNREMHNSRKIKSVTSPEIKSSINSNFESKIEENRLRTQNNLDQNQIESEDISKDDSNYFQHITSVQKRSALNQFPKENSENLEGRKASKLIPKNDKTQKETKIHKIGEKKNKKKSQPTKSAAKTWKENIKNLRIKKNLDAIPNYEDESNLDIFGEKLDIRDALVRCGKPQPILNSRFKKDVQNLENETPNFLKKKDKIRENINLDNVIKYKSRRMKSINENYLQYEEKIHDRKLIDARNSNNLQTGERENIICEFENHKVFETTTKISFHLLNITSCAKNEVPDNSSLEHVNSEDIGLKSSKIFLSSQQNFNEVDGNQSIERNEKPQDFQKRLIGRRLCNYKSPNRNKHSTHKVKNQNSQKVQIKKNKKNHTKIKKGTKKIKHISKKKTKSKTGNKRIKKASSNQKMKKSNSKSKESENVNSKKENYQSQTVMPIQDGRIRVKYIFRDNVNDLENNRDIRGVDFQGKRKDEGTVEKKRQENCENCICDLNQAVLDLRNMLGKKNNLLGKIKTYQCNLYTDIGNEVSITNGPFDAIGQLQKDLEETRGLEYVESEKVENVLKRGIEDVHEHGIFSLPGFNLNVPCNHEGEDITWMMSISRPNYTWIREDGSPISGVVRKNGNLELYDVDTKDTGNYSCIVNYIDPENEEPVKSTYKHNVQVVTLPRYALRGGNRYKLEVCDDIEIEAILTYLPKKLNEILCEKDICEAYIFTPHCHREQIAINALVVPSNTAKLVPVGLNQCGIRCRKAVQDKIALLLMRNVRAVLRRPIVFRLPHHREKLVPVRFSKRKCRHKRGPNRKYKSVENVGEVGLLIGCPAGYNLRDTHCLPCLPGFYSEDGSSHCKKCPLGTHQPNPGARTCQACTNPFVEECQEMIWNSSAAIIILGIIFIVILALSMVLCIVKRSRRSRNNETCARSTEFEPKNEDGAKNSLLRSKKKRKQNDDEEIIFRNETKKKSGRYRSDRNTDRSGYALVSCADSDWAHERYDENSSTRKSSRYKYKPPVPAPDFDI